jgi:hypothetical protein
MQATHKRSTTKRTRSTKVPTKVPTPALGPDPEAFDLNVSGSDDDDDDDDESGPAGGPATPALNSPPPVDVGINNADIRSDGRKGAADIHYFFDVTPAGKICKECR